MKQKKLTFTILSISLLTVMAGAAVAPSLGAVREHFSECDELLVQFIVSLPALFIIMTNLLFPLLCRAMSTKTIAILGLTMYVITGAGAFFADSITILLIFRALLGVSVGMIMPLSTGLLAYYFPPERQASLMGLSAAMNQMGGVVATFLAGFLAQISWNCSFLVYLLGLIALVMVLAFLPNEKLTAERQNLKTKATSIGHFSPLIIGMLLVMTLFFIYPTNFAITSATSMNAGAITLIMCLLDLVAFIVGLFFGKMMQGMKKSLKYVSPLCFLLGYLVLAAGTNIIYLIIGSIIIGLANGVGVPYLNTVASIKGGKSATTTVMPLLSAALYLGQFISPLLVSPCARLFSGITAPYKVGAILGAIFLIHTLCTKKYYTSSV